MKVLNVNHTIDPVTGGGTAERTRQMSRWLRRAGVEAATLTTDTGLSPEAISELTDEGTIILPTILRRYYMPRWSIRQVGALVKDADIVHLMCHWTILNVMAYWAAKRQEKPYVVCAAGSLPLSNRSRLMKRFYNAAIGRQIVRNADGYIAITRDEIDEYRAYGIDAGQVTVIPNGICDEDFSASDADGFREKHGLGDRRLVLFLGRLDYMKGPDLLLDAFRNVAARFIDYDLVYAGPDSGMLATIQRVAKESGLRDRVHFVGYIGGPDRSRAYHAADLLVIPSRREAMSIVVLEAGISGTPVLATDQCGLGEVGEIGGGYVVPCSVEGLEGGLVACLADPTGLKVMGERLQRHVRSNYTWDNVVKRYVALYERILADKHRRAGEGRRAQPEVRREGRRG